MGKYVLAILYVAWLSVIVVNAQVQRISGVVTSFDGGAVAGASVVAKGTTVGTVTNREGYYQLIVPENAHSLVFSFIGMKTVELPVQGSSVDAVLFPDIVGVDEVVVVAYGTALKERFTGSVSTISGVQLERFQADGISKALQGLSSGVLTTSGSGQPGTDAEIRIRGFSTFGDASPLIVLDGFSYDGNLSSIPLAEIESISVLKDASATALYGSRAANGVIIITTRTGVSGTAELHLNVRYGISERGIPEYNRVSVPEYYELQWEGIRNALVENGFAPAEAARNAQQQLIPALGGYNAYPVPDGEVVDSNGKVNPGMQLLWSDNWQEEMMVTGTRKEITLSANGGTDKSLYYLSGAMLDDEGIIKASQLKRYSLRANLKTQFNQWIQTGINLSGAISEQNYPISSGSSYLNPFMFAGLIAPVYPVYLYDRDGNVQTDAEGSRLYDYGTGYNRARVYGSGLNPLGTIELDERLYKRDVFTARAYINFQITNGLSLKTSLSADHYTFTGLTHQNMKYGDGQNFNGRTERETNRTFSYSANQMLQYSLGFDDHVFQFLTAHENYNYKFNVLSATRSGFPFPGLVELDGAAIGEGSGSYEDNYRLESYFAKVDYSWKGRYLASFNVRTDGNSRFAREVRWGNYWGAGVSWRISEESFMQNKGWLNTLRVKMSYGEQGNDKVGSYYAWQGLYETGINNISYPGLLASRLSTPGLTWESLKSVNLGAELKIFNRLAMSFEYYIRRNDDLLFEQPLAPSTGFTTIDANIARLSNSGMDLEVSGMLLNRPDLVWTMDINLGRFSNEIRDLPQESIITGNKRWEVGRSIYDFWMEEFAGVNPETGKSLWFYDVPDTDANGNIIYSDDGIPVFSGERDVTEDYSQAGRYYAGSTIPELFGGVNNSFAFFGFDVSFLLNFALGGKVMDQGYQWLMHSGQYGYDFHNDILNRWTPESRNTDVPAIDGDQFTNRRSTRFLADAGYLSVRNVSVGYSVPQTFVSRLNLSALRLHLTADNLALFSARKGLDPRQSFDGNYGRQYMPLRTISLGFDVQF